MIDTPTVFVLGAGASVPYGFPTGADLATFISGAFAEARRMGAPTSSSVHKSRIEQLVVNLNVPYDHLEYLGKGVRDHAQGTIDAFLKRNTELAASGKRVIAQTLLSRERPPLGPRGERWYELLFQAMDSTAKLREFNKNKLTVITFNYDRSFEHALLAFLVDSYPGRDAEEYMDVLSPFLPIHVHGRLGRLPWQPDDDVRAVDYGATDDDSLVQAANGICIPSDRDHASRQAFADAGAAIRLAGTTGGRTLFLGFGYDETNLKDLGIVEKPNLPLPPMYGTTVDLDYRTLRRLPALKISFDGANELRIPQFLSKYGGFER